MKKTTLYIYIAAAFILISMISCTRNHGDIGPWFGTWHVESITADGTPVSFTGDYFFQFQSRVFRVSQVKAHEQLVESFGTWQNDEVAQMTITFPDPTVFYIEMPGLEVHNQFAVTVSSKRAVFTKTDESGITYTYSLKKQP